MAQLIALTGASGSLGGPTIARLLADGARLRVLSSHEASAEKLRRAGAHEVILGDLRNARDLDRLVAGVDTLIHIAPSLAEDEDRIGQAMIDAAKRAKTPHFLYISCFHSVIPDMRHHVNKLRVEQALIKSGLSYTILQPAMFMQNLGHIWPKVEATGVFAWPWEPDGRYTMVDVADIADAVVVAVSNKRLRGGTYELCSDDIVTVTEMAAMLGDAMGRKLRTGKENASEFTAFMKTAGWPEWSADTALGMCRYHDAHAYDGGNAFVLEAIIGRKATRYADFARRWVAEKAG